MNIEKSNFIKLKQIKLNDLINQKNEDRMTLVDTIISIEKHQLSNKKLTNEWKNKRWFELKTMDYRVLLKIFVDLELQKLTSEEVNDEIETDKVAYNIIKIYEKLFSKTKSKYNYTSIKNVNEQIKELEKNNIDIGEINDKIIYYIQRNKDRYFIGSMIEYLHNVYVFFKPELRDKYVVICYLDYDEIKYTKGKICEDTKDIKHIKSNKILDTEDLEGLADDNNSDIIGAEELCNCCKGSTKKTMDKIKSKFPKGTNFLMVSL